MKTDDIFRVPASVHGSVTARWVAPDGSRLDLVNSNTVTYSAADVLAEAYGGDDTRIPKYIGFIYGSEPSPHFPDIDRDVTWESLKSEVSESEAKANILVQRFSRRPDVSINDPDGHGYKGNAVSFHAVTRSGQNGTYAFDVSGESAFSEPFGDGKYVYQAVLLGESRGECGSSGKGYTVLARVSMKKGDAYRQKPSDYELSVDWTVSFF